MNDKTIIRKVKNKHNPYVLVNKTLAQDPNLSAKEKGILFYVLSLPDDWRIFLKEMVNHFADGRDSIYSGFNSLIRKGYVKRGQMRDDKGHFLGYEYQVFESLELAEISGTLSVYGNAVNGFSVTTNNDLTNNNQPKKKNNGKHISQSEHQSYWDETIEEITRKEVEATGSQYTYKVKP